LARKGFEKKIGGPKEEEDGQIIAERNEVEAKTGAERPKKKRYKKGNEGKGIMGKKPGFRSKKEAKHYAPKVGEAGEEKIAKSGRKKHGMT